MNRCKLCMYLVMDGAGEGDDVLRRLKDDHLPSGPAGSLIGRLRQVEGRDPCKRWGSERMRNRSNTLTSPATP